MHTEENDPDCIQYLRADRLRDNIIITLKVYTLCRASSARLQQCYDEWALMHTKQLLRDLNTKPLICRVSEKHEDHKIGGDETDVSEC